MGATVNDVVLAAIGGGTRRYLTELGELPESTLTASVPVGLERDVDTINALEHYSLFGLLPIALGQKTGAPAALPPLFNFTVTVAIGVQITNRHRNTAISPS